METNVASTCTQRLYLSNFSNELFEWIIPKLDLQSICNLRLVNREIAHKTTQRTFHSFFRTKRVNLSRSSLECFVRASSGPLGGLVADLTIVGIAYDYSRLELICNNHKKQVPDPKRIGWDPEQLINVNCTPAEVARAEHDLDTLRKRQADDELLRREGRHVSLLREALQNVAKTPTMTLPSLSLEVAVFNAAHSSALTPCEARSEHLDPLGFQLESIAAAEATFRTTIAALSSSGLSVESIDMFHTRQESLYCSLPYDSLKIFESIPQNAVPFAHLKVLFISIADRLKRDLERSEDEKLETRQRTEMSDPTHSSGVLALLSSCRQLENLRVSFYDLNGSFFFMGHEHMRLLHAHKLLQARFSSLRAISLGGMEVQLVDLTAFLLDHSASLRSIEMTLVKIGDGLLSTILSLIASDKFRLDKIHLADINDQATPLVYFDEELEGQHTTISGAFHGRNVIHRWGPDTKKVITYSPVLGRRREADCHAKWRRQNVAQFGRRQIYARPSPDILSVHNSNGFSPNRCSGCPNHSSRRLVTVCPTSLACLWLGSPLIGDSVVLRSSVDVTAEYARRKTYMFDPHDHDADSSYQLHALVCIVGCQSSH
jgi:hypothetical protein